MKKLDKEKLLKRADKLDNFFYERHVTYKSMLKTTLHAIDLYNKGIREKDIKITGTKG